MTGTTKGVWHRPHDKKKFDANYDLWQANKNKRVKYVPVRKLKQQAAQD